MNLIPSIQLSQHKYGVKLVNPQVPPDTGSSYDNLLGTPMDADNHPANNLPEMTQSENNPLNPANELGKSPMQTFSSLGKKSKRK